MKVVPNEIKRFLKKSDKFLLRKIKDVSNTHSFVGLGDSVTGNLKALEFHDESFGIVVQSNNGDYIRTSAVRQIVDSSLHTVTFQTVNSVYMLEKLC